MLAALITGSVLFRLSAAHDGIDGASGLAQDAIRCIGRQVELADGAACAALSADEHPSMTHQQRCKSSLQRRCWSSKCGGVRGMARC